MASPAFGAEAELEIRIRQLRAPADFAAVAGSRAGAAPCVIDICRKGAAALLYGTVISIRLMIFPLVEK